MLYDEHVYRLLSTDPPHEVFLPKDLEWVDESTWSPVEQSLEYSLQGSLFIQEGVKLKGRTITLQGKDDMSWINREVFDKLILMRNIQGLTMSFSFLEKSWNGSIFVYSNPRFTYNVMFNHSEGALDLENVKRFDNYEPGHWFKIRNIRLIEV